MEASDWDSISFLMTAESDRQFDMEKVMRMGFTEGIERREIVKGE